MHAFHLTSGTTLQSDGRAQEPYACFDQAAERMEKRLRRYKERLKSRHMQPATADEQVTNYVLEALDEDAEHPSAEQFSPTVIAERRRVSA